MKYIVSWAICESTPEGSQKHGWSQQGLFRDRCVDEEPPKVLRKNKLHATPYEDVLGKEEWKDKLNTFNAVRNAEYEGLTWKNPAEKWLEDKVVYRPTSLLV